tara:strand:+ start:202 stop:534 length:333 start_codon:yes stop_codon:yes gene_type:complete
MTFVRKKVASYKWPVRVESPSSESAGKFDIQTFDAVFNRLKRSTINELADSGDADLIDACLLDWEGIEEEDGTKITCNKSNKAEFIDDPYWSKAVINALLESLEGAKAKN